MSDFFTAAQSNNLLARLRTTTPPPEPVKKPSTHYREVADYLDEYEYRGEPDYKPGEAARQILLDFGIGLVEHLRETKADDPRRSDIKRLEETVLRKIDELEKSDADRRWLAVGRTHLEQAFMAIERAVKKPQRIDL